IPPSVMIIVYAAVAGQSVVKLYASAMFPGFFLAFLYLIYIVGWALINPKVAPKLPESETRVPTPDWVLRMQEAYSKNMGLAVLTALVRPGPALQLQDGGKRFTYLTVLRNALAVIFPLALSAAMLWGTWWYVVIHQQQVDEPVKNVSVKETKPAVAPPA